MLLHTYLIFKQSVSLSINPCCTLWPLFLQQPKNEYPYKTAAHLGYVYVVVVQYRQSTYYYDYK